MDDFQFYPITRDLARRLFGMFDSSDDDRQMFWFKRTLDPSAGRGDLLKHFSEFARQEAYDHGYRNFHLKVDACELDVSHHPTLREEFVGIVGHDFMEFRAGAPYGTIVMNPPFRFGAEHVLHAWDIAYDAEIGAVINAETLRNPYTQQRQRLLELIKRYGRAEFVQGSFSQAERPTDVEVALVYLRKRGDGDALVAQLTNGLQEDKDGQARAADMKRADISDSDVAIPASALENSVRCFDAALKAIHESIVARARAHNCAIRLGPMLAHTPEEGPMDQDWVRNQFAEEYDKLKDRAWTMLLRSTHVSSKVSSSVQKNIEREFERIKQLEFSLANIRGFLLGLAQSAGDLQLQMCCDTFDLVSRYHSDNLSFYRGWKSNDLHHRLGRRIKMTRFIVPGHPTSSHARCFDYAGLRMLRDIDQTFALLDGKRPGSTLSNGLEMAFDRHLDQLRSGQRVETAYFDVRYFQGIGTIHFFPRRKDLVDRLNRVVGRHRRWLPPDNEPHVPDSFWQAYAEADRLSDAMVKAADHLARKSDPSGRQSLSIASLLGGRFKGRSDDSAREGKILAAWDQASLAILQENGLDFDAMLEQSTLASLPAPQTPSPLADATTAAANDEAEQNRPRQGRGG